MDVTEFVSSLTKPTTPGRNRSGRIRQLTEQTEESRAAMKDAFRQLVLAVVDDTDLDMKGTLAQIREIIALQERLMGETPKPEAKPEPKPEPKPADLKAGQTDAPESRRRFSPRLRRAIQSPLEQVVESEQLKSWALRLRN